MTSLPPRRNSTQAEDAQASRDSGTLATYGALLRQPTVHSGPDQIAIVEMFGPTMQGEGRNVGQAAYFLRLAGCPLTCTWCDTPYSWDPERIDPARAPVAVDCHRVLADLRAQTADSVVRRLVITGGEPLLQRDALRPLAAALHEDGWTLEVETAGTLGPGNLAEVIDQFTVSPKLANSGVALRSRIRPTVLREFAALPGTVFKFVVAALGDLEEVAQIVDLADVTPERVFVMAEGTDADTVLRRSRDLADDVFARGWSLTPRWHTLLWGDARGR